MNLVAGKVNVVNAYYITEEMVRFPDVSFPKMQKEDMTAVLNSLYPYLENKNF